MKIRPEDFETLKQWIDRYFVVHDRAALEDASKDVGWNHEAFRWYVLHGTGLKIGDGVGIHGDLNLYA